VTSFADPDQYNPADAAAAVNIRTTFISRKDLLHLIP
jgi:hypothetical protein